MQREQYVYINGSYFKKEDAKISVFDHGLLYGDGVFEAIRAYTGIVFKLKEHIDRLYDSAKSVKIEIGITKEEMKKIVLETLRRNALTESYVRIVVTRGEGTMGVDPRNCEKPSVIVIAEPRKPLFGEKESVEAIVSSLRRVPRSSLDPRIKTLNYLNNILAKIEAIEAGVEEAIMLTQEGYVAETSTENIFIAKGDEVITPPQTAGILKGITRDVLIGISKELGYEVKERELTIHELYTADEVFVTGTAAGIVSVTRISGRVIGDGRIGEVSERIRGKFKERTRDPREGVRI